jgi:hypothetical protein
MRSAFLVLVALLVVFCVASAYAAPPCPGGVCPVPAVIAAPVVVEVVAAPTPRQPVRGAVRGVVTRKPVRSAVKAVVSRKPVRRVLSALRPCR